MKILMLAPQPFFQPRGTPISVYFRLKALSHLGHKVDLVTYHLGEDRDFSNVRILRTLRLPFIKKIKIGPSWAKIPLDFLMLLKAIRLLFTQKYDLIFSHEEAAFFGAALAKLRNIPHIYDMHSSLPQQLDNFQFSRSRILKAIFIKIERYILRRSATIIVICKDLLNTVEKLGHAEKTILLENYIDFSHPEYSENQIQKKRQEYATPEQKIVFYAGNFQPYQGISLLLEAAAHMTDKRIVFLLVGDTPEAIAEKQEEAKRLGIQDQVYFTGQVEPELVPLFIKVADVLVSPRLSGTNTPLKIYSLLKSGKPLVATNLWTHTQVLNDKISILVEPKAESLAKGIQSAAWDETAQSRAQAAQDMAASQYTFTNYIDTIERILTKAKSHKKTSRNSP